MAQITNDDFSNGNLKESFYWTWEDCVDYIDRVGNNQFSGVLAPTPTTVMNTAIGSGSSFTYYHLAPAVGFKISVSGSTVSVSIIHVNDTYNGYPYSQYSPTLTFFVGNSSTKYKIGAFGSGSGYESNGTTYSLDTSGKVTGTGTIYINCNATSCGLYDGGHDDDAGTYNNYYKIGLVSLYTAPSFNDNQSCNASGTTIKATCFTLASAGTDSVSYTATCNGVTKSTSSGGSVVFTGLTMGTAYTVIFNATDGTTTATKTVSITTYACTLSLDAKSTCRAKFTYKGAKGSNANSKNGTLHLYKGSTIGSNQVSTCTLYHGDAYTWEFLSHNTNYIARVYMVDVKSFSDNSLDCYADISVFTTDQLKIVYSSGTSYQHSLETKWITYAGSTARYTDSITSDAWTVTTSIDVTTGSTKVGITDEATNKSSTVSYGTSSTATITWSNLTYYCTYTITATVSDGTNTVSATITLTTIYPYVYIYTSSGWQKAMVYIYNGSAWQLAVAYGYNGGWKEANGE